MPGTVHAPIERLVQILTISGALKLADHFGGVRVYVPHPTRVKEDSELSKAIGVEAARLLAEEWPSLDIMVPRCAGHLRALRNSEVRRDRDQYGLSARQCALKYELTERSIYLIWDGENDPEHAAPAAKQTSLF